MFTSSKKIISLLAIVGLTFALQASAAWAPPTAEPTGNNTPSPINVGALLQEKLGTIVAGGLWTSVFKLDDGNQAVNFVLASDASGFGTWTDPDSLGLGGGDVLGGGTGTVNYLTKWVDPTTIGDSQVFDNGTNVGVGTTTPTQKLDVSGNVKATQFCLPGTNPTGGCIGVWPDGSGGGSVGGWVDDGTVVRLETSTDKVGIGTSSPSQQLEITKNMALANTNSSGTTGVIFQGGDRFIHNYGNDNLFIGKNAGNFSMSGSADENTAIGNDALSSLTSGYMNTAVGTGALSSNTSGTRNIAIGKDASKNSATGSYNVAIGHNAMLSMVDGSENTAIGFNALKDAVVNESDSGTFGNTAVGYNSMDSFNSGHDNTALGANTDFANGVSNSVAIGVGVVVNDSNTMVFGNSDTTGWGFGVHPDVQNAIKVGTNSSNGNGAKLAITGTWVSTSDRTKKHNIENISYGLEEVLALRPVGFKWNGTNKEDIGFIAQEVKEVIPEVVHGEEGEMTLSYGQMSAVLTKAIQELEEENNDLRKRIEELRERLSR